MPTLLPKPLLRRAALLVFCAVMAVCASAESGKLFGRFSGTILCADCSGILLELTLYSHPAVYQLKQTYEGTRDGAKTFTEKGTWLIRRGSAKNPHATIYELDPAGSDSKQFYLRANKDTLRLLDRQKQELPPQLPHTLRLVK